jgi:putative transposase
MLTSGTYRKEPFFRSPARLTFLCDQLLRLAAHYEWQLQAWAVFPNHYPFIGATQGSGQTMRRFLGHLHAMTAKEINFQDRAPGRRVWFQYWDSHLTLHRSYLARLRYVHDNAVHHGLVRKATQYAWCSAGWFQGEGACSFVKTVMDFPVDRVKVLDEFTVDPKEIQ